MKKPLCFMLLIFLSVVLKAADPFFPLKKGMVLEYADKNPKGKVQSYIAYTVEDVQTLNEKNLKIAYKIEAFDAKKKPTMQAMQVVVNVVDGAVHFDASSGLAKLTEGMVVEGEGIVIPSDLKVGDKLDDYTVSVASVGMTTSCKDIRVTAKESLVTEAGSFETFKVESSVASKVLFINTQGTTAVWYARGIGDVKTETYDKKGKLLLCRELVSVKL